MYYLYIILIMSKYVASWIMVLYNKMKVCSPIDIHVWRWNMKYFHKHIHLERYPLIWCPTAYLFDSDVSLFLCNLYLTHLTAANIDFKTKYKSLLHARNETTCLVLLCWQIMNCSLKLLRRRNSPWPVLIIFSIRARTVAMIKIKIFIQPLRRMKKY